MPSASDQPTFTCVTCEATTPTRPTFHVGLPFCCPGCVAGGPCTCSYDDETDGTDVEADLVETAA